MKSRRPIIWGTAFLLALTLIQTGCVGLTASSSGDVTFSPTKVDFGQVAADSKKTVTVTLTNTGSAPITLPQATIAGASYSMSGLTLPATLAPNSVVTFSASFAPTVPGTSSGAIIVSSNDPGVSPPSLALTGTGLNSSGPTILTQPANQSVTIGQTANFTVTATGTGTLSYQWTKNGSTISGATAASYITPAAATSDSGAQFTVVVTDSVGTVTSNAATLTVTATPLAPSITTQPSNASVTAGQTATFSVTASGTSPLSYQWTKNGANISGATASVYTTPSTTSADGGAQFSVLVTNAAGSATSSAATLTVNTPVTITSQPVSQTVTAGQTATFSVNASGAFSMTYQWRKNGVNISGATAASYTTPVTTTADNGAQFSVVITSLAGSVTSSSATLTVTATPVAPSITAQPASQTVTAGQTATFSVTASGSSPLSYQWRKNGANISGATGASYATPTVTTVDTGTQFSVVVNNSIGSATSTVATLTVNAATLLLSANPTSLNFGSVNVSGSKMLSVTITNTGNSSVTVANISQSGPGFGASGVSSGLILTPGQTATLNVTFAPSSAGSATGSVSLSSNATNSPASITLTGSGVQPVQHTVTLSWSASTSAVAGYYAYRGTVSGGPYVKLNSSPNVSLSYADSTVQSGQTYYYVVTSVDSSGVESTDSNQAQAVVPTP